MKNNILRVALYFLGTIIMAFSISLIYRAKLGSAPLDSLSMHISLITGFSVGTIVLIVNMLMVIVYFAVYRNKDIIISALAVLVLSGFIDLFNSLLVNTPDDLFLRIIYLCSAIVIMAFGISLILTTKLALSAYDGIVALANDKIFKRLNYGTTRIFVESFICIISLIIALIGLKSFGEISYGTVAVTFGVGPIVNFFTYLYKRGWHHESIK